MAKLSEAIDLAGIAAGLPSRIHEIMERHVAFLPTALHDEDALRTMAKLDRSVADIALVLIARRQGGDRMISSAKTVSRLRVAVGGEPDRCLGDRRQSRLSPRELTRSAITAAPADCFSPRSVEGSGGSCAALWRGDPPTRSAEGIGVRPR